MARKIVITSGKGGVGKTTVAANLGVQLAKKGCRVLLADLDFGLNNIDVVLGVENMSAYDVTDVIEGRCRARQALVRHPRYPLLYCLASNQLRDKYVSPQSVRLVLESLLPQFDYLLIDSPAGIDDGFHRAISTAEEALLVTTPHISAMRDADRVAGMLKNYRLSQVGLLVNMARGDLMRRGEMLSPREIAELLRLPLVSVIPEEDALLLRNVAENSRAFRLLAKYYREGKSKVLTPERVGLFGGFR